jgi:uncharacterized protein YjbI with pentapeptide repeats
MTEVRSELHGPLAHPRRQRCVVERCRVRSHAEAWDQKARPANLLCTRNSSANANHSMSDEKEQKVNSMTYQKPLGILVSGNTLWNTWRHTYPDVQAFEPDLHGVDLHQAQLRGIDFHEADLTEADLQQADLRGADLREADLRHTNLRGADLSDANLQSAHIRGADLRGANLCRANLQGADLSHADLRGADLSGTNWKKALLDEVQFDEADLPTEDLKEVDGDKHLETLAQRLASVALHTAAAA